MTITIAALFALAAAQDPRLDWELREEPPPAVEGILGARMGVLAGRGYKFDAVRTDAKQVQSNQEAFFAASAMAGLLIHGRVLIFGSVEGDVANKITQQSAALFVGWREHPVPRYGKGVPDEVTVYAGGITGAIDVHEENFGDFDRAYGFGGGLKFGWHLSDRWTLNAFAEYRYLKFDYKPEVLSGDTSIGGNSGWFGVGMDLRF